MYFFLISFFISLFGIILMIGRKLLLLPNSEMSYDTDSHTVNDILDFTKIKNVLIRNIKRSGFIFLIIIIRISLKLSFLVRKIFKWIKNKMVTTINKYILNKNTEVKGKEKEVSSFLKMVSDYKKRIKYIKHKIKEEEGIK